MATTTTLTAQEVRASAMGSRLWARTRKRLVSDARQTAIAVGVGFGVAWLLNIWIMAARYDGFRVPTGTPATGVGNTVQGTIFYLLASALLSAVITYRISVGGERFSREVRDIPRSMRRAVTADGDQTIVHVLVGLAGSMIIVLMLGPSTAAVLAVGSLLVFLPFIRAIVTGLLMRAYRKVMLFAAPSRSRPPATVSMMVGIIGSTGGFALGAVLPGGSLTRLGIGVIAVAAAILISRGRSGGGATTAVLMITVGAVTLWLGDAALAFADDGGFQECGQPGFWSWLTSCDGSGTVMGRGIVGATAAAAGAGVGAAAGTAAADDEEAESDSDDDWDGGPGDDIDGPSDREGEESDSDDSEEEEEEEEPTGPRNGKNPFDLDDIDLEDIDWDLVPVEIRERIRNQLIHAWREKNPGADYIRQQEAGREIDAMLTNDGPIKQWMDDAWEFTKDSAAFTWEDFKSGGALMSIIGATEGMLEGLKTGAIGVIDIVKNAPEMLGVAVEYWAGQDPSESVRQVLEAMPEMGTQMAEQFVGLMTELQQASLAGDNQRVGEILGKVAGQAQFEVLMGAGALKATQIGREAVHGTRIGHAIEQAEDFIKVPRGQGADIDMPGPTRRPDGEEVNVRELENDFGYEDFTGQHLDAKAKELGVMIEMKPANPDSLAMIKNGEAVAKPEFIKPKTANELDVQLGAPADAKGKVAFFEPQKPPGFDDLPSNHPLVERYNDRAAQWDSYKYEIEQLELPPGSRDPAFESLMKKKYGTETPVRFQYGEEIPIQIEVRDGIVYDKASGKPYTGDYDIWAVRDKQTGELVSAEKAQEVYDHLGYASNPQHGPGTAHWTPEDPSLQAIKEKLKWEHNPDNPNGQNLLRFDGEGLPKTTWAE